MYSGFHKSMIYVNRGLFFLGSCIGGCRSILASYLNLYAIFTSWSRASFLESKRPIEPILAILRPGVFGQDILYGSHFCVGRCFHYLDTMYYIQYLSPADQSKSSRFYHHQSLLYDHIPDGYRGLVFILSLCNS